MYQKYMEQIQQGIIPKRDPDFDPKTVDEHGWTIAMRIHGDIPKEVDQGLLGEWEYEHFQQSGQMTVALIYATNGKIPPKQWEHDPTHKDELGYTVAMRLACNKKGANAFAQEIPEQWRHDPLLRGGEGETVAMIYADKGIIPPKEWEHDPILRNSCGRTVAMDLVQKYTMWEHDPVLFSRGKNTVAMYLAESGIIPPKQWEHNPALQGSRGMTVAMNLALNKMEIPKQWRHDPKLQNYMASESHPGTVNEIYSYVQYENKVDEYWQRGTRKFTQKLSEH